MKIFSYDFKTDTFFKKRVKPIEDSFGNYLVCGKQGSNKTFYACYLAKSQIDLGMVKIKTNIKSLKIPNIKIEYFTKIKEITNDFEKGVVYLIDEISNVFDKSSRKDLSFYRWLNQSRKTHRVCILITQEYMELPMWLRRPCKFYIQSRPIFLLTQLLGWYCAEIMDGYAVKYDKDEGEYIVPTIQHNIYKRNVVIGSWYDTLEPVAEL